MLFGCKVCIVVPVDILSFCSGEHGLCSFVVFPTGFDVFFVVGEIGYCWAYIVMAEFSFFCDELMCNVMCRILVGNSDWFGWFCHGQRM